MVSAYTSLKKVSFGVRVFRRPHSDKPGEVIGTWSDEVKRFRGLGV